LILGGLKSDRLNKLVRDRIHLKIINIVSRDVRPDPSTGAPTEIFTIPLSNLMEALSYARRDPPIPILNLSVETTTLFDSLRDMLGPGDYLAVAAAGNSERDLDLEPSYPASFRRELPRRFLTVAASLPDNSLAPFSNRGRESVDLAAPGCNVLSTVPAKQTGAMTGTSQAAPLVAFTAALLYSEGLTLQEVRNRIRSSVRVAPPPLSDEVGTRGLLDIPAALSIHEDLVTTTSSEVPLRGRIVGPSCLTIAGQCRALQDIARLIAPSAVTGGKGVSWLKGADGEIVERPTQIPDATLVFRKRDDAVDTQIQLRDVRDIVLALRRTP
jgi:hypothetical protein